jgi:hypothetical protein
MLPMSTSLNIDWIIGNKIGVLNSTNPVESPDVIKQLENEGYVQIVTVRPWLVTMAWRLPESKLRNFMVRANDPYSLSQSTLFKLNEFCIYELAHSRQVLIWFENAGVRKVVITYIRSFFTGSENIEDVVQQAMQTQRERYAQLPYESPRPSQCRQCHEGTCYSDLVCHATTIENAIGIVQDGRILSACRAYGLPPEEMAKDPRNAAGDPPDYFEYVMYGPGNCTAVDKLVLERIIGYPPSWEEFESIFQPGVRFYFIKEDLRRHPGFTLDGIHEKIYEELELDPWLVKMIIPDGLEKSDELVRLALNKLPKHKVCVLPFKGIHYRDWAKMAYREALKAE